MSSWLVTIVVILTLSVGGHSWRPWKNQATSFSDSKKYEGSSEFVEMSYHMGPVLTADITVYLVWYGRWLAADKRVIRSFITSISSITAPPPSLSQWWLTLQLYSDQTSSNVSRTVVLGMEKNDRFYSIGKKLTRLDIQRIISSVLTSRTNPLPPNPNGMYLVLTDESVAVDDFCSSICGFHSFTFPSMTGSALPFAWVGNSGKLCPGICSYPFAVPSYMANVKALRPPNGKAGIDGMVTVIAHEMAELASDPYGNGWYGGESAVAPNEIADVCEGIYGSGGGGSYTGELSVGEDGATYNLNGVRRRFLVPWLWHPVKRYCVGPNSLDG